MRNVIRAICHYHETAVHGPSSPIIQPMKLGLERKSDRDKLVKLLDGLKSPLTLIAKVVDLLLQRFDNVGGPINGRAELAPFPLPTKDSFNLGSSTALFRVDLLAKLAFLADWDRLHDEFHTARFAGPVLSVAVLPEVAPLPVAALESVLVEEAHVSKLQVYRQFHLLRVSA